MEDYARINKLKQKTYLKSNEINIEDLYLKDENGKTYFEYIIEHGIEIKSSKVLEYISNSYDLLLYAFENNYILPVYSNIDLFFDYSKHPNLMEVLLEKYLYKLSDLPLDVIINFFKKINGMYFIEQIDNESEFACNSVIKKIKDPNLLYNCFKNIGRMNLMKYANIDCLLSNNPNGVPILQELIDLGIKVDFTNKANPEIAKILYRNGQYNSLLKMDCNFLLKYPQELENYLDLIISKSKNIPPNVFKNLNLSSSNSKSLAIAAIKLLKNGIDGLKIDSLINCNIENEKPPIIYMFEMDSQITMDFIIKNNIGDVIKKIISDKNEDSLIDFTIDKYLIKKEIFIRKILNNEIYEISEKDIYIDDLLEPMDDGITPLEHALKNNINIDSIKSLLLNRVDAISILIKYNKKIFNIEEYLFYEDIGNNEKLIDLLLQKKISISPKEDLRIMDYCMKYNYFDILGNEIIEQLLIDNNGNFLIEKYLDNDNFAKVLNIEKIPINKLFKLYKKGFKKIMINANEEILLSSYNNTTILEDLLNSNIDPTFKDYDISSLKAMEILYKNKRPDLMYKADLNVLINYPSKQSNYLQYLINCYKNGVNIDFEKRTYKYDNKEIMAKCYIQMYKNELGCYLDDLTVKDLVLKDSNNKSLLYYLINLDKELTLNKILKTYLKNNSIIFEQLKLLGVNDISMCFQHKNYDYANILMGIYNKNYSKEIKSPAEDLLLELKELFKNDNKSNMELVEALITSYRYCISVNPIFIEELKKLIEIKKSNPNFCYIKYLGPSYFSAHEGIGMENPIISIINHETGHALHCYLTNFDIPTNYSDVISRISSNPNWLKKVEEYSNTYVKITEQAKTKSKQIVSKCIDKTINKKSNKQIVELLSKKIEEQKNIYRKKGYSEETLNIIFSNNFSLNQIQKEKEQIEIQEVLDSIMKYEFDAFIAIGDIIDAISLGKYKSNLLKNESGKKIKSTSGHGIRYYSNLSYGFKEMVANYSMIIKSKKSKEAINLLRYLVGDELVDLLEEFYVKNILRIDNTKNTKL